MKYADLYEIENDIISIYNEIPESEKNKENDDKVINSIIYHYTQSYLLKNTIIFSELFQKDNGDTFVGLLTRNQLEEHSPKVTADDFLEKNLDYIDNKAKNYKGGFTQFCKDKYDKNFFKFNESDDNKFYLKSLLNDYPLAKIPLSSLTQFSDWKMTIDEYDNKKKFNIKKNDSFIKIDSLNMSEIKDTIIGLHIMNKLNLKEKYDLVFEENLTYQSLNLSERKNYDIVKIDLGNEPAKKLNEIYNIELKSHHNDYCSIYNKLFNDGHKFLKNIIHRGSENVEALFALNRFGICGTLIYGEQFSEKTAHLSDKVNWISSMSTGREFRGNKISLNLFNFAANKALDSKQVLFITTSSPDGAKFLEKQIDQSIYKNNFFNIVRAEDIERHLGEQLVDLLYGIKTEIEISGKNFYIKKVDNPYDDFTSIMKFYRENQPSLDNIENRSQYYEAKEKREQFVDNLIENVKKALKGDEIKNIKKISQKLK